MKHVGVKYCGGCNCEIDRELLVKKIDKALPSTYRLEIFRPDKNWDALLMICGCQTSCVEIPEVNNKCKIIMIAGHTVNQKASLETDIVKKAIGLLITE